MHSKLSEPLNSMATTTATSTTGLSTVEVTSNAKVEGLITVISPMKTGKTCNYYDGEISDNHSSLRFCGFNSTVRRRLEESYEKGEAVVLEGCEIKKSRHGEGLEIIVKKTTDVLKSEKSFQVSRDNKAVVLLDKVQELPQYQRVNVRVKVMHMEDVTELRSGGKVQEGIIADATGQIKLSLWEEHVEALKEGCSFEISGLMVKEYYGSKRLSTAKENCTIKEIDDIGPLSTDATQCDIRVIQNVRVFAVDKLEMYNSCVKCRGKIDLENDDGIGECGKCGTMQLIEECNESITAQLRVKDNSGEKYCLRAFDDTILKIAEETKANLTKRSLLKADLFNMKYSEGVLYYVQRD